MHADALVERHRAGGVLRVDAETDDPMASFRERGERSAQQPLGDAAPSCVGNDPEDRDVPAVLR